MHVAPDYKITYVPERVFCTINLNTESNASSKSSQKTPQKIIELIKGNSYITTQEMAELIGIDRSNVARAIKKLQSQGILRRIGPDKGGHWEVQSTTG